MEGLSTGIKEQEENKELILKKKIEEFRKKTDLLGRGVDENMLECVAVLNLLEMNTAGSCGGHIEENGKERISFPYIYFTAPEKPKHRFVKEQEIRSALGEKYGIKPEDVLRESEEIEREFYGMVEADEYRETEEWKQWMVKNKQLKEEVEVLLNEFNREKDTESDIHLQFARIHPGFRIEAIGMGREEELLGNKDHAELAKMKVLDAQNEMQAFVEFLKKKYMER